MIVLYDAQTDDFSTLGITTLTPSEATVEETANGAFELNMTHPMDGDGRWRELEEYRVIKCGAPVRETPLITIEDGERTETETRTVTRQIYKVHTSGGRLHLRSGAGTGYKILGKYKNGTEVIVLGSSGNWRRVAVKKGGATGWMSATYLSYVRTETETQTVETGREPIVKTVEPVQTREQLFRIASVEHDDAAGTVTVNAQHIFYDLAAVLIKQPCAPENVSAQAAVNQIITEAGGIEPFNIICAATGTVSGDYTRLSVAEALLSEETGIIAQLKARIVRDNYDVYILPDETMDRGVTIRHGKNMTGAVMTTDAGAAVTRIYPVGTNADGDPLYLDGTGYVDSPNAAAIPVTREKSIQYDVRVGTGEGDFPTEAAARAELRRLAELDFSENGADAPTVGMDVDFVALDGSPRWGDYADLQAVHLYDTVTVSSPRLKQSAKIRVTGYRYKPSVYGAGGRYDGITLGTLDALTPVISGFDIAYGTFSGAKLIRGSVQSEQIGDGAVHARQIAAESITAEKADVGSLLAAIITAAKIRAQQIDAESVTTDELTAMTAEILNATIRKIDAGTISTDVLMAAAAEIVALTVESITAQTISTDRLGAALAQFVALDAGTADFELATVQNLLANAFVLAQGYAGRMEIKNLIVTAANLANATIDRLCVKGDDDKYYIIGVGSDGTLTATEYTPTAAEIAAGETEDGRGIIATDEDVAGLHGGTVVQHEGELTSILTTAIAAEKITAQEALIASASIPTLYTTAIHALENTLDLTAHAVTINADDTHVRMDNDGVWIAAKTTQISVPDADGETDKLRVDEDGVAADVIIARDIQSDSVQAAALGGTLTATDAGALNALLENLTNHYLRGDLTIDCSAITSGAYEVRGLEGMTLTLSGGTINAFTATGCDAAIVLDGVTIAASNAAIKCNRARVRAIGCTVNAANAAQTAAGVDCTNNGTTTLEDCDGDCNILARASDGGRVYVLGDTMPYGIAATDGGDVYAYRVPAAKPTPPPPEPETVELVLPSTLTWNYGAAGNNADHDIWIGRYSTGNLNRGCIWFDLTELRSKIAAGYSVISATLTIKRYSGVGGGGNAQCNIYGTTASTSGGTPPIGAQYATVAMANGAQRSVDVTTLAAALGAGTYNGIMLYNPDTGTYSSKTYTYTYSRYYGYTTAGAPVLRVTLQK